MSQKYQLKNGMNVILIESHKSPVVSVQMWVRTGSADEKIGQEGISHFIEHLVFKGSKNYKVGEIASEVEGSGGVLNAYTSFDQTVFYVTISKAFADTGLNVISEMMGSPTFDENEINNEREVVIEEIKRSLDNPHQRASRLLFSNSFKKHPYGIPVIGYEENIRNLSRAEIIKYYQSRYVPQNMNLVIVGDFESKIMKEKVAQYFGQFKKYKLNKVKRATEPQQKKMRIEVQSAQFVESLLYLSWPVMGAKHKDAEALSVFNLILGQGESSRLIKKVRNEKKLVNHIGASAFVPKENGIMAISAGINNDNLKEVLLAIKEEILNIFEAGITDEELDKAKHLIESEKLYSLETVDGQAGLYGHFEFLHKDHMYFDKILKQIRGLTKESVLNVGKKYLNVDKMSISYLTGGDAQVAKKNFEIWSNQLKVELKKSFSIKKTARVAKKQKVKKMLTWSLPKTEKTMPVTITTTKNGIKVLTRRITGSPVISVRAGFLGGLRAERESARGVNELLARVWSCGTKNLTEEEINKEIESMASAVSSFGGKNTAGVTMTSLVPYFNKTLELFTDTIVNPGLFDHVIARESEQMIEALKARNDKPSQLCMLNLLQEIFPNHPYGRDPLAGEKEIRMLDRDKLVQHMATIVSCENMLVSAVGDFDPEKFIATIEKMGENLHIKNEYRDNNKMPILNQKKHIYLEQKKEQSHIALAYRGITFKDHSRYALEIMQSVLSGQGGRLFTELRDKASLAYTVAPIRMDGIDGGYFGAYIGCSPEKGVKAVQMMRSEFKKLTENKISQDEMTRAKRYILGRHDISLQRTASQADHYFFDTIYGISLNEIEQYQEHLESVSAEDVLQLAQKIFSQPEVLSLVGKSDVDI